MYHLLSNILYLITY